MPLPSNKSKKYFKLSPCEFLLRRALIDFHRIERAASVRVVASNSRGCTYDSKH